MFAGVKNEAEREEERRYLEEVAEKSVDELLASLTPDARRLLWTLTRAGEPVPKWLLEGVWSEMSPEPPPMEPLLEALCSTGLGQREEGDTFAFHELVAERAAAWMEKVPSERGGRVESDLHKAYGERYGKLFKDLRSSGKPGAHDQAAEAGRRGIRYLVLARSFNELGSFAGGVVIGTRDPTLLNAVVADLQSAVDEAPAGRARWSVRTYIADALSRAGRPEQALPFYALALAEAEAAEHWSDVGSICQNWAFALRHVGRLTDARNAFTQSADAECRARRPRLYILASELEALRIDVTQGDAKKAQPGIEERLAEVRSWWGRRQNREDVPEAPDDEMLVRSFITALDVAEDVSSALGQWQKSLDLLDEIESVESASGAGEHERAVTRFNRYGPLLRLAKEARERGERDTAMKQLGEAKALLEDCLDVFRRVGSSGLEGKVLSAMAHVWDELGDDTQAIILARQALAICDRMPSPEDRAISHNNLSNYLKNASHAEEANEHRTATLAYHAVAGLDMSLSFENLVLDIRKASARSERFELPRLDALIAKPAFAVLRDFLVERKVDVPQLQAELDALVDQVRAQVVRSSSETA
ncbi:MAG TPA: hypothetical protein VK459_15310 [Polyangiaceae bacterium]|nr:hypothetical protein [Polyangiaceae bacterium]